VLAAGGWEAGVVALALAVDDADGAAAGDGVAVDGVAVDGVAVDGVAVDGVAVDGVAVAVAAGFAAGTVVLPPVPLLAAAAPAFGISCLGAAPVPGSTFAPVEAVAGVVGLARSVVG
jgi:hypothetical protein